MTQEQKWWVYMIETDKGNLYTGITTDVQRRWQEHCDVASGIKAAKGAKFFRSQTPQKIVYQQQYESRSEASCREAEIKAMKPAEKKLLGPA
jgi:putative endonuclease